MTQQPMTDGITDYTVVCDQKLEGDPIDNNDMRVDMGYVSIPIIHDTEFEVVIQIKRYTNDRTSY
jgi:hypothetical protein